MLRCARMKLGPRLRGDERKGAGKCTLIQTGTGMHPP
jgi:hypothetical protein